MSYLKNIITYFFHHPASEGVVERVHQRLADTNSGQEKEEVLSGIWEQIGFPQADEHQTLRAFEKLEQQIGGDSLKSESSFSRFRIPRWSWIAASIIVPLLLLFGSAYLYKETLTIKNELSNVTFIQYYVSNGKREQVTLPDRSKVWLNSGSLLIYPSAFIGNEREVYLAGEGYFSVTKDKECPFIVKTHSVSVSVLGTEFNINAYPNIDKVVTTLEEGSIRMSLNRFDSSYLLEPDDQIVYIPSTGHIERKRVKASDYSDWRGGGLYFSNSPFKEVIQTIERTYSVQVHLQTSIYQSNNLTIHFYPNESIENIMMLIKEMIPGLEYQIEGKDIYID